MEADEGAGASQPAAGEDGRQRKRQRHGGWRELVNYSWLLVSEQTPGVYVPQVRPWGWARECSGVQEGGAAVGQALDTVDRGRSTSIASPSIASTRPGWHPPLPAPRCPVQAGDSVVYLRQGHERFLTATNDKRPPPWQALRGGRAMRPAEPCT